MPMSFRRVGFIAATMLVTLLWMSCGQVYRPVVIPISNTPPNSANFHAVFGLSSNASPNPGSVLQIDVSGDTNIGVANMGINPTHAAVLPNNSRVFVASAGSLVPGDPDVINAFAPAGNSSLATGISTQTVFSLPNVGPAQTFCSYLPDFVETAQSNTVFVANYGAENGANCSFASTDSVALLNVSTGTIANIAYLNPAGASPAPHPVALAETPNAQHLYVVNQGNNTVVDLSPTDLSTIATIPVGDTPVWAVARIDNQRVYVLSQGGGTLVPIDTGTNFILQSQTNLSVGAGANFLLYDPHLNRLYVTNPATGQVFVYSATGGLDLGGNANDTPKLLATISMAGGPSSPCPQGCSPVSIAALPDGSRFYVASYQSETSCSDSNVGATACIIPMLTVFDAPSMTVKPAASTLLPSSPSSSSSSPSLSLLTSPPFSATQYAVSPVTSCAPAPTYAPGTTRFRMFIAAAADSSHVYVSMCDAGAVAAISTTTNTVTQGTNAPDTLITDITAPFGACSGANCSSVASITSFSISSNVVTFAGANNFVPGEQVQVSNLTTGTYLNGHTFTVMATGLSNSQFEISFTHTDVASTTDSGTAVGLQVANITSFSIKSNVVTFQAVNTFSPGTRVSILGLSSTAGSSLDGQTLTVIATGLSGAQFECVLPTATSSVASTPDTGTAVPQVPPQTPIFLLPGQ